MKIFLTALSVVIVLVIAFALCLPANRGEDKYLSEYQSAGSPSPSVSVTPTPSPSVTPTPSPSPSPSEPPYAGPVNPLTGLPSDAETADSRPYAIMINNIKVAQPQLGISKADIIYEILVEGGITRMMALFQDVTGAGEIGSIRSSRPYFVDIALAYDAVYIHAGGSPDAYTELKSTGITSFDGVNGKRQDIFFRDKDRQKTMGLEHSLVTTADLIEKYMPMYGIRLVHNEAYACNMVFADAAAPASAASEESLSPAKTVTAHFSSSKSTTFTYVPEDGVYAVSQYGKAYADGGNNVAITAANVLVLKTEVDAIAGDDKGRILVETTGSGTGYYFCGGVYEALTWSRKSITDQFTYTLENGAPLIFARGRTYVCFVDNGSTVDIA